MSTALEKFHSYMLEFFTTLKQINELKMARNLLVTIENPINRSFQKYVKAYEKTTPEEHVEDVLQLYQKNKQYLLKDPLDDSWLLNHSVVLQFGESQMRILVSSFYSDAHKIREEMKQKIKNLPESAFKGRKELVLCDWIRLHLYRLCWSSLAVGQETSQQQDTKRSQEMKTLHNYVVELETELDIQGESTTPASSLNGNVNPSENAQQNNPLAGLMNMAQGLFSSMGINLPQNKKMPTPQELQGMMQQMVQNPQVQQTIKTVATIVQQMQAGQNAQSGQTGQAVQAAGQMESGTGQVATEQPAIALEQETAQASQNAQNSQQTPVFDPNSLLQSLFAGIAQIQQSNVQQNQGTQQKQGETPLVLEHLAFTEPQCNRLQEVRQIESIMQNLPGLLGQFMPPPPVQSTTNASDTTSVVPVASATVEVVHESEGKESE